MFRPPLAVGMRILDRSFFRKIVPLKAARVRNDKNISAIRSQLDRSKDVLILERLGSVHLDPDEVKRAEGSKCILLRPEVREMDVMSNGAIDSGNDIGGKYASMNGTSTGASTIPWSHSATVAELVKQELISIIPYNLNLDYNYWTYHDIISAILPSEARTEIPSGFSQVGHVAHLNLRGAYLPYKDLIAEILMDKNPGVRTVINKVDDVGEGNEYRTFKYEVLAGPGDLNVEVSESNCVFKFDYSKVYWNPRLSTEHERMVGMFKEGEAVCDVMAGVGPFAVPAGRRKCFVWANDLNPDSYASLTKAIIHNKVEDFVRPSNLDGRLFIREAAAQLLGQERTADVKKKISRKDVATNGYVTVVRKLEQPKVFSHFVLNLPASALEFLPSFIGLYTPEMQEKLAEGTGMPIVHVYCFGTKDELGGSRNLDRTKEECNSENINTDNVNTTNGAQGEEVVKSEAGAIQTICAQISNQLQYRMKLGKVDEGGVEVWDVRDVAPKKRMFCASFRLPEEVAFRPR